MSDTNPVVCDEFSEVAQEIMNFLAGIDWSCSSAHWKKERVAALLRSHFGKERRWKEAVSKLLDYIEAHDWGTIPEPHDSIKDLLVLMGR